MSFFELDDLFTYQDVNDIKKFWAGTADPALEDSGLGEIYLNIDATPYRLKRFNGSQWEVIGEMTAQEILTALKTVDGADSGLDADKLQGVVPDEANSNSTIVKRDSNGYVFANYFNTISGVASTPTHLYGSQDTFIRKVSPAQLVTFLAGTGGLDADTVDGIQASQFIRSDASDDVSGHTEWQDGYQVRLGTGADLRLQHSGSTSYIDNYTGILYIRQLSHGNNIILQAENASGTVKTLLTLDPDTDRVTTKLDRASLPDLWRDTTSNETASPYIQTGHVSLATASSRQTISYDLSFSSTPRIAISSSSDQMWYTVQNITTTSFSLRRHPTLPSDVDWIAIGKKT